MKAIIITLLCLAIGCASAPIYQPGCAQIALFAAQTANDIYGLPTRISVGPTATPGVNHAVAQAYIDGAWRTLKLSTVPYVYAIDDNDELRYYRPTHTVTINDARQWVPVRGE